MLKLQLEGRVNQVQPFLMDLDRRPDLVVKKHENFIAGLQPEDKISVTCYVDRSPNPKRRMRIAQLLCRDGVEIRIPLLDVMEVDMANGTRLIAGRSYDIFADNKKRAI
ncbi:hypothetical protein C1X05_14790 [Laceyella sacchari]|uniref:Uncharacterized protein n=1 Tax=Laceyella tengchongensis TaxID=574699 RepID=A0AA45WQ54_9BACL|nr:hypothetical protein [Laceyella tengchongensis]AUS09967.1 hypothetical protein C1X05_14790 [Laceyella sacchari]SMP22448.1 hypothetical protein SAMN06265361_10467 [Laceyella tengchongensis]